MITYYCIKIVVIQGVAQPLLKIQICIILFIVKNTKIKFIFLNEKNVRLFRLWFLLLSLNFEMDCDAGTRNG
jgi:hypothetical protein